MVLRKLVNNKIFFILLICILGTGVVSATVAVDPVCKMNVTITNTTNFTSYNHTIYYFCSEECKNAFVETPEKYLNETKEAPHAELNVTNSTNATDATAFTIDDKTAICPVCGMQVDKATAEISTYQGLTYYFCSDACKSAFDADPDKYLSKNSSEKPKMEHMDKKA
jgi:P-type Cu+ transporter